MLKELLKKPSSLLISLFVHLFVLFLLWFFSAGSPTPKPKVSAEIKPVQAIAVDEQQLDQALAQLQQQERRAVEQKRLRQEKIVQQRKQVAERKAKELKQRQAEQRRKEQVKKEAEQQRKAAKKTKIEQQRKAALAKKQAEKERQAELKRQALLKKKAAEKRKIAAEKRRQAERVRKAEEDKQKRLELARQEKSQREAEAKRQAASAQQARRNRLLLQYMRDIQQRVVRNWVPPSSGSAGMSCEVSVVQLSSGTIIDFQVANCRGDAAFRRSVESAMGRLMALPPAPERSLFEREIKFKFKG
ncbi:MAG: cell envelope integrity protein TolA [Gammaproteobacteria bacterium]|nr:cell envelope integrity protein TolA [Gammaproteobacteria bacterium]